MELPGRRPRRTRARPGRPRRPHERAASHDRRDPTLPPALGPGAEAWLGVDGTLPVAGCFRGRLRATVVYLRGGMGPDLRTCSGWDLHRVRLVGGTPRQVVRTD